MRRQIIHWSSSGYITILKEISDVKVADAFDRIGCVRTASQKHRRNLPLGTFLLASEEYLQIIMEEYPHSGEPSSASKLLAAFKAVAQNNWVNPYNKETCVAFHQLLVSTLLNYLKAHNKFHNQKLEKLKLAQDLWNVTYLLWMLSQSQILVDHLVMLDRSGCLSIPRYNMPEYSKFGATYGLGKDAKVDVDYNDPAQRPLDGDAKLDLGSNGPARQLSDEDAETGQKWVQTGNDYPQIFRRWVQLQVKHFQSLSILSKLCSQPNIEDVKITPRCEESGYWYRTMEGHYLEAFPGHS